MTPAEAPKDTAIAAADDLAARFGLAAEAIDLPRPRRRRPDRHGALPLAVRSLKI